VKRCYLAGPMRGYPEMNHPAFFAGEELLVDAGWIVFNPARLDKELDQFDPKRDEPLPQVHYVRRDLGILMDYLKPSSSDAVVVLPGWESSTGATAEVGVARWLNLPVIPLAQAIRRS